MLVSKPCGLLHAILIIGVLVTTGCRHDQATDPVTTLETLQNAIADKDWAEARQLFSDEIQQANSEAIGSEQFYRLDYWRKTRTVHNLFRSPPIITEDASFQTLEQSDDMAIVSVSYPEAREKDVRLQRISLERDGAGNWRVAEVFGRTSGIQ